MSKDLTRTKRILHRIYSPLLCPNFIVPRTSEYFDLLPQSGRHFGTWQFSVFRQSMSSVAYRCEVMHVAKYRLLLGTRQMTTRTYDVSRRARRGSLASGIYTGCRRQLLGSTAYNLTLLLWKLRGRLVDEWFSLQSTRWLSILAELVTGCVPCSLLGEPHSTSTLLI